MNPQFLDWWRSVGASGQIAFVGAIIAGLFGVLKVLLEKHPKVAVVTTTLIIGGFLAFFFWPAERPPVIQPTKPVASQPTPTPREPMGYYKEGR